MLGQLFHYLLSRRSHSTFRLPTSSRMRKCRNTSFQESFVSSSIQTTDDDNLFSDPLFSLFKIIEYTEPKSLIFLFKVTKMARVTYYASGERPSREAQRARNAGVSPRRKIRRLMTFFFCLGTSKLTGIRPLRILTYRKYGILRHDARGTQDGEKDLGNEGAFYISVSSDVSMSNILEVTENVSSINRSKMLFPAVIVRTQLISNSFHVTFHAKITLKALTQKRLLSLFYLLIMFDTQRILIYSVNCYTWLMKTLAFMWHK